jgi:hypothetical protein
MFINANLEKLIDQIKEERKFAIFLGAGSSACRPNPAILTANEIIEDLRNMFPNRNLGNNYAQVLKHAFPKQRDRRIYFEKICAARIPCLHHYQLAALVEERIFDAVYTTNFDRIVESAILHYCASHPAVYQHDSDFGEADSADKERNSSSFMVTSYLSHLQTCQRSYETNCTMTCVENSALIFRITV